MRCRGLLGLAAAICALLLIFMKFKVTGLAALFLIARVLHIYGMYQHHGNGSLRFGQAGVMGTTIAIVAMALWVLYLFVKVNL